jgi:hypothetical protein
MNPDRVVGYVWAGHIIVPDGGGGFFSEPQFKLAVMFSDLKAEIQQVIERGLQPHRHSVGTGRDDDAACNLDDAFRGHSLLHEVEP